MNEQVKVTYVGPPATRSSCRCPTQAGGPTTASSPPPRNTPTTSSRPAREAANRPEEAREASERWRVVVESTPARDRRREHVRHLCRARAVPRVQHREHEARHRAQRVDGSARRRSGSAVGPLEGRQAAGEGRDRVRDREPRLRAAADEASARDGHDDGRRRREEALGFDRRPVREEPDDSRSAARTSAASSTRSATSAARSSTGRSRTVDGFATLKVARSTRATRRRRRRSALRPRRRRPRSCTGRGRRHHGRRFAARRVRLVVQGVEQEQRRPVPA
jgi:hypothetical protein